MLDFKAFYRGCTERSYGHNVKIFDCISVYIFFFLVTSLQRHCQTSYSIARILWMTPMMPWQNFTPFLCSAAFCRTKFGNFIRQPQTFPTSNLKNENRPQNDDDLKTLDNPNGKDDQKINKN